MTPGHSAARGLARILPLLAVAAFIGMHGSLSAQTITSPLLPSSRTAGGPDFTLTVNGSGFVRDSSDVAVIIGSRVVFGSTQLTTTFINSTQLTALVPSALIAQQGVVNVYVRNISAGQNSNQLPFTIAAPPDITTSSLPNGQVGVAYNRTLAGTGGATPYTWNVQSGNLPDGLTLSATGVISGTPTTAGTFEFTVRLVDAQQVEASRVLSIVVLPPTPAVTSLDPSSRTAGGPGFTLTVNGGGFIPDSSGDGFDAGSRVVFGSTQLATTFVNSTRLTALVPAALIAQQGVVNVSVFNPSFGQSSNQRQFTILGPPSITTASLPNGHRWGSRTTRLWPEQEAQRHTPGASSPATCQAG